MALNNQKTSGDFPQPWDQPVLPYKHLTIGTLSFLFHQTWDMGGGGRERWEREERER